MLFCFSVPLSDIRNRLTTRDRSCCGDNCTESLTAAFREDQAIAFRNRNIHVAQKSTVSSTKYKHKICKALNKTDQSLRDYACIACNEILRLVVL